MKQVLFDDRETIPIRCSVRDFVEFLLRSGDLDNRSARRDPDTMKEGAEMHRRIQKEQGASYAAEVSLSHTSLVSHGRHTFSLTIEGRADGIITLDPETKYNLPNEALAFSDIPCAVDEIKSMVRDVAKLSEPVPEHLAQAKCYAYFYCMQEGLERIAVQMTYVTLDSGKRRYFTEFYTCEELRDWYYELCLEYVKFEDWQVEHLEARDASVEAAEFPFPYRPGQKELAKGVYRTIMRERKLFLEAPTGVGKTVSTLFPAVKSMAAGLTEKLFYLTAKTITRTVAEDTFRLMTEQGLVFLPITITAKEKLCVLPKPDCNPDECARAKGHFDRINAALYDMLCSMTSGVFSREMILQFAEKHNVCPYEMSLDMALFADAVICDYNYVFDPEVYFRRFFAEGAKKNYTLLIDEAHNLVERAREMYSATLVKEDFLNAKTEMGFYPPAVRSLNACNRAMLAIKKEHERFALLDSLDALVISLDRLLNTLDHYTADNNGKLPEFTLELYFAVRHFVSMYEQSDDHYRFYCDYRDDNRFYVRIQCMDPSRPLEERLSLCRSAVFFSATLLPIRYYKDQLSGGPEDYAVYAESPFDPDNRLVLTVDDVSTRYSRRGSEEYQKIADYIAAFCAAKKGNYIAFFPSYRFMTEVFLLLSKKPGLSLMKQENVMSESEREAFLSAFRSDNEETLLGLCVMGGVFSEGIDLAADRLIGAVIVGPGLPQVCNERELFREYYQDRLDAGFEYAYLYPGMNKVLQAAGRVIRTTEDVGAILLLDDRFLKPGYRDLFPREWSSCRRVTKETLPEVLGEFWRAHE